MVRVKRCNVLVLLTLVGASLVGKVYGDIDYFTGNDDSKVGCFIGESEVIKSCCPSTSEGQAEVSVNNPGMEVGECGCRCGGAVVPLPQSDTGNPKHDYCPAGQGYTVTAHTRYTTLAGGAGGAEGASSSSAPELYHIKFALILWIVVSVMFITL